MDASRTADVEHSYAEWRFAILWELRDEFLYEFAATDDYFPRADAHERAQLTQRLLRELWQDGWATFVRRNGERWQVLAAHEVEAVIDSRA